MKLILFDFDGVLANTEEMAYQIHKVKNKNLTWKDFQDLAAGNFHDLYDKAVKEGRHIDADDFYGEYKKGLETINIHDTLHDLISSLVKNYKLIIISSTNGSYIKSFLVKEKLEHCFSDILGADVHRSKVSKIKTTLEKYDSLPQEAVFITDTTGDIAEARECSVQSIGVTWGLHDREFLSREKPFALIDTPGELGQKIEEFFK